MTNANNTNNTNAALTKEQIAAKKLADQKADKMAAEISANRGIWQRLCATDPSYTKQFNNGSYKGTSIAPMYVFQKLTELFGPNGIGWGWNILNQDIVDLGIEKLVFVTIEGWYKWEGEVHKTSPQIAGEKLFYTTSKGRVVCDDEAFKKAITDGATKCFTYLGSSADVHLGLHDDVKTVGSLANYSRMQEEQLNAAKLRKRQAEISALAAEIDDVQEPAQEAQESVQEPVQEPQAQTQEQAQAVKSLDELGALAPQEFVVMIAALLDPTRIQRGMEWAKTKYQGEDLAAALAYANAKLESLAHG